MADTLENCTIGERTMEDFKVNHNKMLRNYIAGHHCCQRKKFHESFIHAAISPINTVTDCHCSPEKKIGDSFETLPDVVSLDTTKRQTWNKHCHNRTE